MIVKPKNWVYLAILLAIIIHGALLPFTYGQTYDAYIHMFFGNHYFESWFDPWETKWYTGFTVTAYPPGSHQLIACLLNFVDMRAAFILVMILAIALLIIGVYRFSRIWVGDRAGAFAALLAVFASGISETVHVFGQLPTILSIGLFLNAMPHMAGWIERGTKRDLLLGLIFTGGATSVHHVTPLFGTIFFVAPIGVAAWMSYLRQNPLNKTLDYSWKEKAIRMGLAPARGIVLGLLMVCLLVTIVFPYWHWSITDPITQVNIGHGSRESFIDKPNLGLMFFVIPWGLLIGALPYVFYKLNSRLWPLSISVIIAFVLGTGGTTPIPEMVLGPAFGILTLDRFTFWGTLLILPFAGLLVQSMVSGRLRLHINAAFGRIIARAGLVGLMVLYGVLPLCVAALPIVRPMQPDFIDPAPLVKFMDEDNHARWRYLTLGFGDQFAYHSALINAESVDGNYHSARRLPALTNYAVERLENSKFAGVPGLASLNQFLTNADKFHLKFVFSNDEYYDPLLHYSGWNKVTRLGNGIMVWEKQNITPLPDIRPRRTMPRYQVLMWGILPLLALSCVGVTLIILALRGTLISGQQPSFLTVKRYDRKELKRATIWVVRLIPILLITTGLIFGLQKTIEQTRPKSAADIILAYYTHLSFREMDKAYALLSQASGISYENFLREQRLTGGLVPSYGSLNKTKTHIIHETAETLTTQTTLTYLTSIGYKIVTAEHQLFKEADQKWRLKHIPMKNEFSNEMVLRSAEAQVYDLTSRNIIEPNREAAAMLQRPEVSVSRTSLLTENGRVYAQGRVYNSSAFPACIKVRADALDEKGNILMSQNSGELGAHRLQPGESSPFMIRFEGFLKIGDAGFDARHDPTLFSLPEFEAAPVDANIHVETTVCTPESYKQVSFENPKIKGSTLTLQVTNTGRLPVSTLQLKLTKVQIKSEANWTQPAYLQFNLRPGERRDIKVNLKDINAQVLGHIKEAKVNGRLQSSETIPIGGLFVQGQGYALYIDYDAMTYQQKE